QLAASAPAPVHAAEPLAVLGLRSGTSRGEIQAAYPGMVFKDVPYLDPQVGDVYRYLYGGLATLRIEGSATVKRGPLQALLRVTLTGDRALYHAEARVREEGLSCEGALGRLRARYGRPALGGDASYTLWREAQVLYAMQLEFRCLDARRGIYTVTLDDPFRQRLFIKSLAKRLQPALEATHMVLR
ncbi:MAG: hypothetical protein ACREH6_01990, partial [Geminicoccaceae bacterium]